ncbi:MAG: hypothetical protein ACRC0L_01310, partial [Angustibacter sp.]
EGVYTADAPSTVAPGSEYPLTTTGTGTSALARTVKRGFDTEITDEAVARQNLDPVNRALIKLVNRMVQAVDAVALSAVATAVTSSAPAAASWSTATSVQIIRDVELARAQVRALNQGFEVDTVVLDDITFANVFATLATAGILPREGGNPVLAGNPAQGSGIDGALGLRWLRTPNLPTVGQALLLDSTQLGGIANEDLGGEGYAPAGALGIQVKSWRPPGRDVTRIRARRVSVPIVLEPQAGRRITGV